jgi:hypothetical protein
MFGIKRPTNKRIDYKSIDMGVWHGVAMDSLKFHPSLPCPTLLRPAGGPPLKWQARRAGGLQPSSTPLGTPRRTPMNIDADF